MPKPSLEENMGTMGALVPPRRRVQVTLACFGQTQPLPWRKHRCGLTREPVECLVHGAGLRCLEQTLLFIFLPGDPWQISTGKHQSLASSSPAMRMVARLQEGGPGTASPRASRPQSLADPPIWISHPDPSAAHPTAWGKALRGDQTPAQTPLPRWFHTGLGQALTVVGVLL